MFQRFEALSDRHQPLQHLYNHALMVKGLYRKSIGELEEYPREMKNYLKLFFYLLTTGHVKLEQKTHPQIDVRTHVYSNTTIHWSTKGRQCWSGFARSLISLLTHFSCLLSMKSSVFAGLKGVFPTFLNNLHISRWCLYLFCVFNLAAHILFELCREM